MGRGTQGIPEAKPRRWRLRIPGAIGVAVMTGVAIWMAVLPDGVTGEPAPASRGA